DKQLANYNKAATTDENEQATLLLRANDIACWGSFIVHPDWDKDDFKRLMRYIRKLKPELTTFSPLVPHPMTPLYETFKSRLLYDVSDYDKWNFGDVLIRPSKMSLRAYYFEVLKLALMINFNWHSVRYTLKAFPLRNTLKMLTGFNTLFSVYIKNFLMRH
ncbi:MAG TPA: B12-binding domain-containing radical SAM protein, partial [Clostridiales bacterium UBA8960]|nr:B12-binding domain-containing radical SAM protein [Clostridiales bacterium UBA8960]